MIRLINVTNSVCNETAKVSPTDRQGFFNKLRAQHVP